MATDVFKVNGVTKTLQPGWSIREAANGRNLFDGRMLSLDGTFRLVVGDEISLTEDPGTGAVTIYGGTIDQPAEAGFGGQSATAAITLRVSAVDFNEIADRREVVLDIPAGTTKTALIALAPYYTPFGVSLDGAQANGPSLPALSFHGERLREVLDQISALTDHLWTWNIGYTKVLSVTAIASTAAPFNLTDANVATHVQGDITVEQPTAASYANYITVLAGTGQQEVSDAFTGNGVTTNFVLTYTLAAHRGYVTNGGVNEPMGVTTPPYWTYDPVTNSITRSSAPANLNAIAIIYTGQFPFTAIADGGATPANRRDRTYTAEGVFDAVVAQALADAYLARDMRRPRTARYTSPDVGLHPGQKQTITNTKRNLSGDWVLTDVEIRNTSGNVAKRLVTAVEGTVLPASVGETVMAWGGTRSSAASGGVSIITSGGVGGTGTAGRVAIWATASTLTDTTDIPLLSAANNTFTGAQTIASAEPLLYFYETDQGLDLKRWRIDVGGGVWNLQTLDDAGGSVLLTAVSVGRTGGVIANVNSNSTATVYSAVNASTGAAAVSRYTAVCDAGVVALETYSAGYSGTGMRQANASAVLGSGSAGMAIAASNAAGAVRVYAGGMASTNLLATFAGTSIQTGNASANVDLRPFTGYTGNLGLPTAKYLTLSVAELLTETLVAQNVQATIGGRVLVAPANVLAADLSPAATSMTVKYNNFVNGDRIRLEAHGSVEWMAVTSSAGGSAGAYTYTLTRNLDGSGADQWYAGDAAVTTGTTGAGFIDLYSTTGTGIQGGGGPAIVISVRTGTTYSAIAARAVMGNLNFLYGYAADTYGFAAGDPSGTNVTMDATNGFRVRNGTTNKFQADTSGNLSLTGDLSMSTSGVFRGGATAFATATGWWLDYNAGTPRFRVGNPSGNRLSWDGTTLTLVSSTVAIDSTGIHLTPYGVAPSYNVNNAYDFVAPTGVLGIGAWDGAARGMLLSATWTGAGTRASEINLDVNDGSDDTSILMRSDSANSLSWVQITAADLLVLSNSTYGSGLSCDSGGIKFQGGSGLIGQMFTTGGMTWGAPTGGDKGAGTINVAGDLYKNNTAYTNPDYVFEHWATGRVERFAANPGAAAYAGLRPLPALEAYVRAHHRFPQVSAAPAGVFRRADLALELIEQQALYLFDHEARIAALEEKFAA